MIFNNIYATIGNTPVVRMVADTKDSAEIYAKLEFFNAGGSVKDRIAKKMILGMLKDGSLNENSVIVEATSGNTGVGVAMVCASLGLKAVFTMPESMSIERRKLLLAYGAKLELTDAAKGMSGAIEKANDLSKLPNHVLLAQFDNKYNAMAHLEETSLEIINDFDTLDCFIAGIGTGGTVSGNGKTLKEHYENIKIVGVEPFSSPFLTQGKKGPHKIQGIGAGFKPSILDLSTVDEVVTVTDQDAFAYARKSGVENGILLGVSGGASYKAACEIAKKLGAGKKVLFIAPDNGERYLSTGLYEE